MSSNLRVNNILPTVGTNVAIGTAGGSITLTGGVTGSDLTLTGGINATGVLTATTFSGNLTGNVTGVVSSSGISTFNNNIELSGQNANIRFTDTSGSESVIRSRYNLTLSADHLAEQGSLYSNLIFKTDGSERVRITSDGSVGIGTNNPTTNLQVNAASNEATISLYNATTKKAALQTQNSFGTILYSYDSEPLIFSVASGTSYSERARVTSTGNVQIANGNLVFSTAGTGIDFSANSNAAGMTSELLDDYEEGTWTPTVWGGGNISSAAGRYIKIGKQVYVSWDVIYGSTANGDAAGFQNLPFTVFNANEAQGCTTIGYNDYGSAFVGLVLANSTRVVFYTFAGATLLNSNFSSKRVMGGAVYEVA